MNFFNHNLDFVKIKNICSAKDTVKRLKERSTD